MRFDGRDEAGKFVAGLDGLSLARLTEAARLRCLSVSSMLFATGSQGDLTVSYRLNEAALGDYGRLPRNGREQDPYTFEEPPGVVTTIEQTTKGDIDE